MGAVFRRPTGGYGQYLPYFSKKDFVDALVQRGKTVAFVRVRKGEWNEGTDVLVDGSPVHFVMKGERVDWRKLCADLLA